MKTCIVVLAMLVGAACGKGQETWQAEIKIENQNPSFWATSGNVWLTGNRMVCLVRAFECYRSGTIRGPATTGTNAPVIFPLDLEPYPCQNGQLNWSRNEFFLTDEQVAQLRAGFWYVLLDDDRSQIVLDRVCRFMPTNAIEFSAEIRVRTSLGVRLTDARFGLTGDNFSYEITMPSVSAPYFALIWDQNRPIHYRPIVVDLGTVECLPVVPSNAPTATDLGPIPQCVIRGAVCAVSNYVADLLIGQWLIFLEYPFGPGPYYGLIKPLDGDHDGVPDYLDQCPATATNSLVNAAGCSIEDLCPCAGPWKNHGEYLRCLVKTTKAFLADGLITAAERRAILRQALHSDCGRKKPHHAGRPPAKPLHEIRNGK